MKENFISLKIKLTIGVIMIFLLTGLVAILAVNRIASDIVDKEYEDKAEQIAEAVVASLDEDEICYVSEAVMEIYGDGSGVVSSSEWGSDEWNSYMSKYSSIEELPEYQDLIKQLRVYQDIFEVDCIYVIVYRPEVMHAIYVVDGDYVDACPPGCVDSFDDGIWPDENNSMIPATITNEDVYGWLVSTAYPVKSKGEVVPFIGVDISMNEIKAKERGYVITITIVMLCLTILLLAITLWYVSKNVIKPVMALSDTAKNYCSENNDVIHHAFEKIQINTHDEISQLLSSMKQMEADMNMNINKLIDTKVALKESEEIAGKLQALAVKDTLTGIRNKTAYDGEVQRLENELAVGFKEFGLAMVDLNFLKKTNDTYGHEKGNLSIIRLCKLVCVTFEHSPVFRVGGDEFVIVLKNNDLRGIDRLIDEFNSKLEEMQNDSELEPWEKISAAIGYATYDEATDKTVEDVFRKADKAMYERKVAMKAERKD